MNSCSRWRVVHVAAVLALFSSCSHQPAERLRRLAIVPPELLINDPADQWLASALPLVLEEDLATASDLVVEVVRDTSDATRFGATQILRTTVEIRNGRLHLQAVLTDASTQLNQQVFELQSTTGIRIVNLANAFAKRIDSSASTFSTENEEALEIFTKAVQAGDPAARIEGLNNAISIDPAFGLAYIVLARAEAQRDPAALPDLLTKAGQHAGSFTALDRAKFNALASQALHAPISQQRIALRTVLQLAPNTLDALAQLGSLRFLQGDATNGQAVMARALELSPGNTIVLQQLGRGLIETRQFAQAEKILTALDNNPGTLPALATCILLEGDLRRANTVSERFARTLQPDVQPIYRASWLAVSGNLAGAISALNGAHLANPRLESAAMAELVIWHAIGKNFGAARLSLVSSNGTAGTFAPETVLISRADAPFGDWLGMVHSSPISAEQKQSVLAFGSFLAGHYDKSAEYWQQILSRSGGTDLHARAMLASSLDRSGHSRAAQKIEVQPFVPEFGDLYAAVSFAEMRRMLNL